MSLPSFFHRLLPHRRQAGRRHQAAPASSFTVLGFHLRDTSAATHQYLVEPSRNPEEQVALTDYSLPINDNFEAAIRNFARDTETQSDRLNLQITMPPGSDTIQNSPPRKRVKFASEPKLKCRICFEDIEGEYLTPCTTCKRPQCFNCITGQWSAALNDREQMPARCCSKILYHEVAKDILPPAELSIYKLRFDESNTANPFYCPVPTCSTFIPPRMLKPVRGKVTCPVCATQSCFKCRTVASNDHSCPETKDQPEFLKTFKYKQCPKCGIALVRMYGCPHIRCVCGAHVCYDCLRPINACYMKPCRVAREEGDGSQGDFADHESDDEVDAMDAPPAEPGQGNGDVISNAGTNPILEEVVADSISRPEEPGTGIEDAPTIAVGNSAHAHQEPAAGAPDRPSSETTVVVEVPAVPVEQLVNLDDPDNLEYEWEQGDYDFGEEPTDEYWDVWGCMHRFREFTMERVPEYWLKNLDTTKATGLECMTCFKDISIEGKALVFEGPKKFEESTIETNSKGDEDVGAETEAEIKAAQEEKRKARKNAVFECKECGVICCYQCKRGAIRKLTGFRKAAE